MWRAQRRHANHAPQRCISFRLFKPSHGSSECLRVGGRPPSLDSQGPGGVCVRVHVYVRVCV